MVDVAFIIVLIFHILAVMVGVGTVTVTDYLHLLGLRNSKLEKKSLFIFPHLSKLIVLALVVIYLSGVLLVLLKPVVLTSTLFWIKVSLVVLVTINGKILHNLIFPKLKKAINKKKYPKKLIKQAAFAGSLSIVSWYGIVILATTKSTGYLWWHFLLAYFLFLTAAYLIALKMESIRVK